MPLLENSEKRQPSKTHFLTLHEISWHFQKDFKVELTVNTWKGKQVDETFIKKPMKNKKVMKQNKIIKTVPY